MKYGEKKRMGYKGWKKRKREADTKVNKEDSMEFIPVKNNRKQKMPPVPPVPPRDPRFNMEELVKANPGIDPKLLSAAVDNMMQSELSELGKRSVEERDSSPPFKKTYAEASSSHLALETSNPYENLALTELTQSPSSQSPMIDLVSPKPDETNANTGSLL